MDLIPVQGLEKRTENIFGTMIYVIVKQMFR